MSIHSLRALKRRGKANIKSDKQEKLYITFIGCFAFAQDRTDIRIKTPTLYYDIRSETNAAYLFSQKLQRMTRTPKHYWIEQVFSYKSLFFPA